MRRRGRRRLGNIDPLRLWRKRQRKKKVWPRLPQLLLQVPQGHDSTQDGPGCSVIPLRPTMGWQQLHPRWPQGYNSTQEGRDFNQAGHRLDIPVPQVNSTWLLEASSQSAHFRSSNQPCTSLANSSSSDQPSSSLHPAIA